MRTLDPTCVKTEQPQESNSRTPPLKRIKDGAPLVQNITLSGHTRVVLQCIAETFAWSAKGRATRP